MASAILRLGLSLINLLRDEFVYNVALSLHLQLSSAHAMIESFCPDECKRGVTALRWLNVNNVDQVKADQYQRPM